MTEAGQDLDLVAALAEDAGLSARHVYLRDYYFALLGRMQEAHALSGQMIAALDRGDMDAFGVLGGLYQRANEEAGAALVCLSSVGACEGSA